MTISASDNRISDAGNDTTTEFPFPYKFLADEDLVVLLVTNSTGVSVTQVLNSDYTVTGAGDQAGGAVTVAEVSDPSGFFSVTKDNATTYNIYPESGNYIIQNKRGSSKIVRWYIIGANI